MSTLHTYITVSVWTIHLYALCIGKSVKRQQKCTRLKFRFVSKCRTWSYLIIVYAQVEAQSSNPFHWILTWRLFEPSFFYNPFISIQYLALFPMWNQYYVVSCIHMYGECLPVTSTSGCFFTSWMRALLNCDHLYKVVWSQAASLFASAHLTDFILTETSC